MNDILKIGSLSLTSRLFLGSSQYPDLQALVDCIDISGTELVTVGIRRIDLNTSQRHSLLGILLDKGVNLLPNTAGCYTAREAILMAELAREALKTNRIKLEVIGDDFTLYPDSIELLKAAEELVKKGFEVYPYAPDDVVICQKLADLGCVCVMPLASPIGSGRGIQNPYNLAQIRKKTSLPLIVDAGIGTASDAAIAMELGADGVLINTAIAKAGHPVMMAESFALAVKSGRLAYLAKRISKKDHAQVSTSDEGKINLYRMKM
jgi:thiazole synthase